MKFRTKRVTTQNGSLRFCPGSSSFCSDRKLNSKVFTSFSYFFVYAAFHGSSKEQNSKQKRHAKYKRFKFVDQDTIYLFCLGNQRKMRIKIIKCCGIDSCINPTRKNTKPSLQSSVSFKVFSYIHIP